MNNMKSEKWKDILDRVEGVGVCVTVIYSNIDLKSKRILIIGFQWVFKRLAHTQKYCVLWNEEKSYK